MKFATIAVYVIVIVVVAAIIVVKYYQMASWIIKGTHTFANIIAVSVPATAAAVVVCSSCWRNYCQMAGSQKLRNFCCFYNCFCCCYSCSSCCRC